MSWDKVRADLYCESVRDGTHDTPKRTSEGYKLATGKCLIDNEVHTDGAYFISEKDYNKINQRSKVEKYDVLMSMIGNVGSSVVIQDEPNYAIKNIALYKIGERVKAFWLHYYLSSSIGQQVINKALQGSAQPFISLAILRNMLIPNPPYEIMEKVVNILSRYDALVANCRKQIKLLEEAAERLYKEWFVDLRFPGSETSTLNEQGLPDGWEVKTVGDLGEFKRGKTITRDSVMNGDVPVVAGGLSPAYYHNQPNTANRVITVSGSGANAGFTRLYYQNIWASDCSFLDTDKTEYIHFVYCVLKANKGRIDNMQKGSAQPHVYAKDINAIKVLVPETSVLCLFEKQSKSMFDMIGNLEKQIKRAQEARDRLLPKLMSGEIEV